jgi:hypothetical protein
MEELLCSCKHERDSNKSSNILVQYDKVNAIENPIKLPNI